jgi:alkanesulfonate monooxygenase SsuD/methylene tetrahydromethanopterin reductase-like flavin-dependent oxidoreductase (luciferase family)
MRGMKFGVALDFGSKLRPLSEQLERQSRLAELAESAGFELVAAGEIAAPGGFHLPNALLVLAALAQRTRMGLCSGIVLLPAWQPSKLALDVAELDQLSGGRVVLGVGLGSPALHAHAGWSRETIGARADETLQALRALWSGATEYHGTHVSLTGGLPILPAAGAEVPIWVGGSIRRSAVRAARHGNGWYAGVGFRLSLLGEQIARFHQGLSQFGKGSQSASVAVNRVALAAPDSTTLSTLVDRHLASTLQGYARGESLPQAAEDTSLIGTPDQIVALVERYQSVGVTHLLPRLSLDDMPVDVASQTIELFGRHVIPRFRG